MGIPLETLLADWLAETWALEAVLDALDDADWALPTPAAGWTIAHQIAHLAWTDEALALSMTDPDAFARLRDQAAAPGSRLVDEAAEAGSATAPGLLSRRWRAGQRHTSRLLRGCPAKQRLDWFGPPMGPAAAVSARIMETFAHGQDVRDTLGAPPESSPRLRHVIHLAVAALPFSFANRSLPAPVEPVRVEAWHAEQTWSWGPEDAANRIRGNALELALWATRRRHPSDLNLEAAGPVATAWLGVAQAYAGPPGPGRPAASTPVRVDHVR